MDVRVVSGGWPSGVPAATAAQSVDAELRAAQERLREHLVGLPVVVGVRFDTSLQRAVIVVREVSTGRVLQQIPPDTPMARLAQVREQVAASVHGKGGIAG